MAQVRTRSNVYNFCHIFITVTLDTYFILLYIIYFQISYLLYNYSVHCKCYISDTLRH